MRCSLLLLRICALSLASFVLLNKSQKCYAQSPELPNVISSTSPTAAGLSRYIDFPVSLSNGVPDISIPIYTLSTSRLKVPISLGYHAGGIKVMDRTSTMGLGWTLSAGGVINRVIHGFPDELAANNFLLNGGWLNTVWPSNVAGNGSTLTTLNDNELCVANHLANTYITGHFYDNLWDGEPDIYYFSAPGLGGKFLYRNAPDASGQRAVVIPYQPIKISNPGSTPAFTITGTDGVVYQFGGAIDINTVDKTASNPNNATSAWHLSKMISADGSDEINFIYGTSTTFQNTKIPSNSIRTHYGGGVNPGPSGIAGLGDPAVISSPGNAYVTEEQSAMLTEITSKNADIVFNYTTLSVSMKPLQSIDIYSITNGVKQKIKTYTFTITQFAGGGPNSLRLDAVTETGYQNGVAISTPPYKITYTTGDVPPYDTKAQDLWGYYNGQLSNTDLTMVNAPSTNSPVQFAPQKRTPDAVAMMKGMIQSITYPTGGNSNFTFEPNQISTTTTTNVPNNRSESIATINTMYMVPGSSTTGIDLIFTVQPPPTGYTVQSYSFNFSGTVYSGCTNCINNKPQAILLDITSTPSTTLLNPILTDLQSGSLSSQQFVVNNLSVIPGRTYRLYFVDQGVLADWNQSSKFRLGASVVQNLSGSSTTITQTQTVLAGGLRIQKIDNYDPVTGQTLRKTFNYTKPYFITSNGFNGDYFNFFTTFLAKNKWFWGNNRTAPTDPPNPYTSNFYYLESPTFPVGGSGNTSVAYQEVEEMQSDPITNSTLGKTVYTFNTATDYIPGRLPNIRFDNEEVRKQLKSTKIYKTGDFVNPVKEIINDYTNVDTGSPETPGSDNIKFFIAATDFDYTNLVPSYPPTTGIWSANICPIYEKDIPFTLLALYYNVSRNFLSSTTTRDYDGTAYATTTTNYTYGNYAHMQPTQITTTDSKSQLKTQSISYPLDFANITGTSNDAVGIKNLQNLHVITSPIEKSSYVTNTSNVKQLTSSVFTTYHPTLPLPAQISVAEFTVPPTNFTPASVASGDILKDSRYQPRLSFAYDATTGNTTEQQKVNDVKEAYLWGYNGQYPVAKILNTTSSIASSKVSQNILDNPTTDEALRTELNKLRSITDAKVTTYTYAPLIGPISETDANNKTTYYEYDGLSRLKNIKDYQGNIVKNFQYNYQNSCGNNCVVLAMQTFTGYNTPSYPVGVFNGAKQYIGTAATPAQYVSLWNSNTANQSIGVLSTNADSMHFNLSLATNATPPPVVYGLRFYKWEGFVQTTINIASDTLSYIDWGDGSHELLTQPRLVHADSSAYDYAPVKNEFICYLVRSVHVYSSSLPKTLTVFHNETTQMVGFNSGGVENTAYAPNITGYYPEKAKAIAYNYMPNSSDLGVINFNKLTEVVHAHYQQYGPEPTRHNAWQSINNFHKLKWIKMGFVYGNEVMSNLRVNFPALRYLECQTFKPNITETWSGTGFPNLYILVIGLTSGTISTSEIDLILNSQGPANAETNGLMGFGPMPIRSNVSDAAYNSLLTRGWILQITNPSTP